MREATRPENIAPVHAGKAEPYKFRAGPPPPTSVKITYHHLNKPIDDRTKQYLPIAVDYAESKKLNWGWYDVAALHELVMRESGWNPKAANVSSSARGIGQTMMSAHFGKDWRTSAKARAFLNDPAAQIRWMVDYIKRRYGTPLKALEHHQRHNWY